MLKKSVYIFLITIFFLLPNCVLSQKGNYEEYHYLINKSKKSDKDSIFYFNEKALKSAEPFPNDLLLIGYNYYKKGNKKKAKKMLFKSIEYGFQFETDSLIEINSSYRIEYDMGFLGKRPNIDNYIKDVLSKKKNKIRKLRKEYVKKNSITSDNKIFESLLHNEKYFQDLRFLFIDNKITDTIASNYVFRYGSTPNSYYALDLLKSDKFPRRLNCVRWNEQSISLLLNHIVYGFTNNNDALEFVNLLWNLVEIGDITPYEYAKTYDHYINVFVEEGKNLFGTVFTFDESNKLIIVDLVNPTEVNLIRGKYWLVDIEFFCKSIGASLPKNYMSKNENEK